MNALFGQDLPAPRSGQLSLYLLGPGIGESVVAIMPDLRAVVVDVCECDGANLTLELLGVLGVEQVDLLAISHPDLDHVRGLSVLLDKKPPRELWRYPGESSARDFALAWAKRRRETPLANALRALGSFLSRSEGETFFASYGDRVWPHPPTDYRVHSLAPTTYDQDRALRAWNRRLSRDRVALDKWLDDVVAGRRPFGDAPNVISLALAIEVGSRKVLLGGDVLRGTRSPRSGWKGIVRLLEKHGRGHLLQTLTAIKVAHHGSLGALDEDVWQQHAFGAAHGEPIALIAPFSPSGLPDQPTLARLLPYARALAITDGGDDGEVKLTAAGWRTVSASHVVRMTSTKAPCVALQIEGTSLVRTFVSAGALCAVARAESTPTRTETAPRWP